MNKKNNTLLKWGLVLGITSIFFYEFFIVPISALIINYIAFMNFDTSKDKGLWKGVVGFCLGVVYFLAFLYANEKSSAYFSEVAFKRQSLLFLIVIAVFIYFPITRFRESEVYFKNYMYSNKNVPQNKQTENLSHNEITDTIIKLGEMVDNGLLTQEEFNSKKKDLLNRL